MDKDYNTGRPRLRLREYGRNVQKLVEHIQSIKDVELRTKYAHTLTNLMQQIVPGSLDQQEGTQKFWDDMQIISDFTLEVDGPYETPTKQLLERKPEPLKYSNNGVRFKHYGKNVELLVEEALKIEDEEAQQQAIIYIGKLMKTFHLTWNKESVDDKIILRNIAKLSDNKLVLKIEEEKIEENLVFEPLYRDRRKPKTNNRRQNSGRNHRRRRN